MQNIIEDIDKFIEQCELEASDIFKAIDKTALHNQQKVLNAFKQCEVGQRHFAPTNGYGYDDIGRDKLNEVLAKIFNAESAIASPLITSGTHALTLALFGILRPRDRIISITGKPYDTLTDVISKSGIGSLKDFDIEFDCIDLFNGGFDFKNIKQALIQRPTKAIYITKSRGYNWQSALSVADIKKAVDFVKDIDPSLIVVVDNCYGEFTETIEPIEVGADIAVGSFIKNLGGGIAPSGGYIVGTKKYVDLVAGRLTAPGLGCEIGSYVGGYRLFFEGLFMSPHVVAQSLKGAVLMGEVLTRLGYEVLPKTKDAHNDIIKSIRFSTAEELIEFCRVIQASSPIDSHVIPYPWDMPGYENQVIMAAGTFVQGASIELTCDAPIRPPYIAYLQGALTYEHLKLATINVIKKIRIN